MGSTAKHAFPWPPDSDPLNQGAQAIKGLADALDVAVATDSQGLFAARPAAGTPGRFFYATDLDVEFRDDGTNWRPVGRLLRGTLAARPSAVSVGSGVGYVVLDVGNRLDRSSGTSWVEGVGSPVLDRPTSVIDVVNTAVETQVYAFSIPANALVSNNGVRLTLIGDYLNNSASGRTLGVAVKFGGVTLFQDSTANIITNTNRRDVLLAAELVNKSATNAQLLSGRFTLGPPHAAAIGRGDLGASPTVGMVAGDGTVDTTAAATLEVAVTHSAADATTSFRRQRALLELL